jgi:hypothetical protein
MLYNEFYGSSKLTSHFRVIVQMRLTLFPESLQFKIAILKSVRDFKCRI